MELPTTKIEVWNEVTNTAEQVIFTKEQKEIIIATSVYSMAVSKVNLECGKDLITNEHFDKVPLYITEAALFYNADIELKDLNGNTVPKVLLMFMFLLIKQTDIGNGQATMNTISMLSSRMMQN